MTYLSVRQFPLTERFWAKVTKDGPVWNGTPCWVWMAYKTAGGYGQFSLGNLKRVYAHRFSYEATSGAIPMGLEIDHLCRNRACVNPDHLEPVITQVNCLRGVSGAARNALKMHCPRNHPYEGANVYVDTRGKRVCRTCNREYARLHRQKAVI